MRTPRFASNSIGAQSGHRIGKCEAGITDESQALLAEYDEKFYGQKISDDPASSDDSDDHVAQPAAKCLCLNDDSDDEQYSDEDIDVSPDQFFDRECQP